MVHEVTTHLQRTIQESCHEVGQQADHSMKIQRVDQTSQSSKSSSKATPISNFFEHTDTSCIDRYMNLAHLVREAPASRSSIKDGLCSNSGATVKS